MKIFKRVLLLITIIIIIIGFIFTYQGYEMYKDTVEEMGITEEIERVKSEVEFTKIEDLTQDYIDAVIAVEDRRFFNHSGIDLISIARAVITDIKEMSFVEGGSTITQQVAKNVYFHQKKEFTRKIAEVFMAFQLEKEYTKDEIFEIYVNTSYFGDGYYCVADATQGYFEKKPKEMTLYESTLLAGIPNAPSVYAPTKNPELAKQRQMQVIAKMVKYGYLTQEEADNIIE